MTTYPDPDDWCTFETSRHRDKYKNRSFAENEATSKVPSSHSKQPFDSRQLYEEIVLHTVQLRVTGVPFHPICGEQADGVVSNHGVSVRPNRVR